jgi:hypothetical protein
MENRLDDLINNLIKTQRLSKFAVSESGFLFDPQTGQSFTVNQTGLRALQALKRGESLEEIASNMAVDYKITPDQAANGLESFILQLGRYV